MELQWGVMGVVHRREKTGKKRGENGECLYCHIELLFYYHTVILIYRLLGGTEVIKMY